ncbi:MAG: EAL domain-containing protein [Gammaproteobacteria bacterium SHHR-1]|uniref:EAL domain-containing protein n=1 Tax=Magnetovirga frankeli TaxID=947516 RepID=UPI0012939C3F|nr:EAL domain-containing protein [gamma proteobacterium SS-5]
MTLKRKLLFLIAGLLIAGLGLFQYLMYDYTHSQAEADLLRSAERVRGVLMATRRVYHHQFLDSGIPLTDKTLGFLPAHALGLISEDFPNWEQSGFSFNNVSHDPRNPEHEADPVERQAIDHFQAHPQEQRRFVPYRSEQGELFYHYAQPIWIEPYCLECHGSKASAPAAIRARYDRAYDYQVGELRGILSIKIPAQVLEERVAHVFFVQFWWSLGLMLLLGLGIVAVVRRHVLHPIGTLQSGIERMTQGQTRQPLPDLPGEFRQIGNAFNQMVERLASKRAALEDSEKRLRMLMQTAADAVVLTDSLGHIQLWNDGAERIFGHSAEAMQGRDVECLIPEPSRAAHRRGMERVRRGLPPKYAGRTLELYAQHQKGHLFPIELSLNFWDSGAERHFIAIIRDISARKYAEEALRESEAKFHTIVNWSSDWVYWIKPDGGFHYMTPAVEQLTGYRAEDFERDPDLINAIVHPDDQALWLDHVQQHLPEASDANPGNLELRIRRKDGQVLWVNHRCRAVFDPTGQYLGRRVSMSDISERKAAEERIYSLAYYDPLTGLPNRRLFLDHLNQALLASQRGQLFGALLMLDLDHFKNINETHGHELGDLLLIETAKRIQTGVRLEDRVCRLGGDEYLILVEGLASAEQLAATQTEQIAEKLRAALSQPIYLKAANGEYQITPSIGISLFRGADKGAETLLKQVEVALYQAKDAGRDTIRFFNRAMQEAVSARSELEAALRRAIRLREFVLYYQPQMDQQGRLIGAEALLRWNRPGQGLVPPDQFIPLAEETGLIVEIGGWVLETACEQLSAWAANPRTQRLQIAVNVSTRQFQQPDFVEQVQRALSDSGARPERLKIELTESVVLNDFLGVSERMKRLHQLGVRFSLDDFGTGYSSLSYLKRLPIDQVKIDKSFVQDIPDDSGDMAIVRAVLALCQSLGLEVVAEGVENQTQREFLQQHGCQTYQGYLFGRPSPISAWPELLQRTEG